MTLLEVITKVKAEKPNSFSNDKLTEFINEVEADVAEFLGGQAWAYFESYVYANDQNSDLIAPPPYDRMYPYYVMAKIDYALEEYESYANNMAQFMSDFTDYKDAMINKGIVKIRDRKGKRIKLKNIF